jgi:pilus assembly protein Flp/PilA
MLYVKDESGQGLVEYALILVLVAIAAIVILGFLGDEIVLIFTEVRDALAAGNPQP